MCRIHHQVKYWRLNANTSMVAAILFSGHPYIGRHYRATLIRYSVCSMPVLRSQTVYLSITVFLSLALSQQHTLLLSHCALLCHSITLLLLSHVPCFVTASRRSCALPCLSMTSRRSSVLCLFPIFPGYSIDRLLHVVTKLSNELETRVLRTHTRCAIIVYAVHRRLQESNVTQAHQVNYIHMGVVCLI